MFGFFKTITDAIKEGVQEAKEELAAEQAQELESKKTVMATYPKRSASEQFWVALGAPYREIYIGDLNESEAEVREAIYLVSPLLREEKQAQEVKELLVRDFNIANAADWTREESQWAETSSKEMRSLLALHVARISWINSAAISVGFTTESEALKVFSPIILNMQPQFKDWADFGHHFIEGDKQMGDNSFLARKLLARQVTRLLKSKTSPWLSLTWGCFTDATVNASNSQVAP